MDKEILKLLGYSDDEAQKIIDKAADAPTDVLERLRTALAEKAALSNDLEAAKKDGEEKDKQLEAAKTELANSVGKGDLVEIVAHRCQPLTIAAQ